MKILCAYIRENAPASEAVPQPQPGRAPKDGEHPGTCLKEWVETLPPPRVDIQTALTVIGNRSQERRIYERALAKPYALDLHNVNLQCADLYGLNLAYAILAKSRLEGASAEKNSFKRIQP